MSELRKSWTLAVAIWRSFVRDRMEVFFVILFPLMFLVLFGGIFTSGGPGKSTIVEVGRIGALDSMPSAMRAQFDRSVSLKKETDLGSALSQLRKGDVDGVLVQDGNRVLLHFSQANQVTAAVVQGTIGGYVQAANVTASDKPPTYQFSAVQVEDTSLKSIQYIMPGLLGWAVATNATFGAALTLVQWRVTKLLRRLRLAPVSTGSIVLPASS
ncbi:MAG: ABC transporter permease [Nocardioidaceae bacterium]